MARTREERIKARKAKAFRRRVLAIAIIVVVGIALVLLYQYTRPPPAASNLTKVIIKTNMGDITIELFDDMPITTSNFKNLVSQGAYDSTSSVNVTFHRVVDGFVIQGGDVSVKGINAATIQDELPNKHSNVRGTVAMAKTSAPNSATSQFFINLVDNSENLDSNYSVFGRVVDGMSVVDAIAKVQVDANDRPLQDVMIFSAKLVES
jgi:peptidylprolyl isomerase